MRFAPVFAVALVGIAAQDALAAATACDASTPCATEGQVCRLATSTCVYEVLDDDEALAGQELRAAINSANLDAALDVIVIGEANPVDPANPRFMQPRLNEPIIDATLGNLALPPVSTPITIEGADPGLSIINLNEDAAMRMFVVRPNALDVKPVLTLRRVQLRDARAGGQGVGGTAVHVTALATTTGELPGLIADNVLFTRNENGAAPVFSEGDPPTITNCTFQGNFGVSAGAIATVRGAAIGGGSFLDNFSDNAGAIDAQAATFLDGAIEREATLSISGAVFERNAGGQAGAVRSLARTTSLFSDYRDNRSGQTGGALLARNLSVQGGFFGTNFAPLGGGAIALIDTPASAPLSIAGAAFSRNFTDGAGGAVFVNIPATITDSTFDSNEADSGGGAIAFAQIPDRNAGEPDVRLDRNIFRFNVSRATVTIATSERALDERGADTGTMQISLLSLGSAVLFDAVDNVEAHENCIFANSADAVVTQNGSTNVDMTGNWWGADSGAGPAGGGDRARADAGLDVTSPLTDAPASCLGTATGAYPLIFVDVTVDESDALIQTDYRLVNSANGIQILNSGFGQIRPDTRTGVLDVEVRGVNDAEQEGAEGFTFSILQCSDGNDCLYATAGTTTATFTISDNGDGNIGEGEGEGEDCEESVAVSTTELLLPNAGTASIATVTVTNNSPCAINLFPPFVQAGASQGFSVKPLAPAERVLEPGGAVDVQVQYTPPDESTGEEPVGVLQIETDGGTLIQIALGLEGGCSCRSSASGPPIAALVIAFAVLVLGRRRR